MDGIDGNGTELVLLKSVASDVRFLLGLYCGKLLEQLSFNDTVKVPLTYTLVRAFESSFYDSCELKSVRGYCVSGTMADGRLKVFARAHSWLTWKDGKYIIDLVPIDGVFTASVPQVVCANGLGRFVPEPGLYPKEWNAERIAAIEKEIEDLSQVLDGLLENIKF